MAAVPPVILVFDIGALSAASPSEWREFSRVGSCYVPQVVYEEMRMLFDRSPDPDLERIAKAFNRFYATSGWKITDANAHHQALKVGSGQALTRRARVSLAVGRCAYGLAQEFPNSLVVLVSKDRSLLQRLYDIPSANVCGIPGEALLQWSRTGQRPIAVSQKFQQFRSAHGIQPAQPSNPANSTPTTPLPKQATPVRAPKPIKTAFVRSSPVFLTDWLPELKSLVLAVFGIAIAGYLIWILFTSSDLGQIFQQQSDPQSGINLDRIGVIS
ncbi:MAG: hypothetical protein HC769_35800 [Cyanobacteria bacterium CRU_2_1]|nr:hypothetical protein [Cyanobacteria bacterium RU_5_0]NJR63673.1 hypothetical protein [Cyanobacteria bacterium CRU_2_1]